MSGPRSRPGLESPWRGRQGTEALIPVDAVRDCVGAGDGLGHAAGDRSTSRVGGGPLGFFAGSSRCLGAVLAPVEGDADLATVSLKVQRRVDQGAEDGEQEQNRYKSSF